VEDDLGILVDGRIDDAFAEEEVLLRKEVQWGNLEPFIV
jgi:hypothetical protein